jgi:hypothetical protein
MANEDHHAGARVFWYNTNRDGRAGGESLEQRMRARHFAAAWTGSITPREYSITPTICGEFGAGT